MPEGFLSEIIFITIAAFIGGFAARTIKLPPVLGYIASGIIFGIIGRNFFENYDSLITLSQFGVSLLLFTLGFEISFDVLKQINKRVFFVGALNVLLVALFLFPILLIFGLVPNVAILLALLFSFSSTAVIVKILEEKGMLNNFPGDHVFIYLLIQDLFIIPIIFFLPPLFSAGSLSLSLIGGFIFAVVKPLAIFAVIFFLSRFFLSRFINLLFRYPSHELTILATIFTATVSILLFSSVGLPGSVAAFLAGVLISEQGKNLRPMSEIRPFRDLFLVLFFVTTGMLLDFSFLISNLPYVILLCLIVVGIKFSVIYLLLRFSKHSPSASVFMSSHLANVGEFSIVIAQIAFLGLYITEKDYNLVLSVFILSLVLIPVWLKYLRVGAEKIARYGFLKKWILEDKQMEAGVLPKFENHVVICGHGRVGRETRSMLELSNIPFVVVDFNRKVISELLAASKYAIYGDPTDEDILKASFIETAKALVIAVPDTFSQKKIIDLALKLNPKITIFCRSHIDEDRFDLINMGVNTLVVPEFEAGLRIGTKVLESFRISEEHISYYIKRLRSEHLL